MDLVAFDFAGARAACWVLATASARCCATIAARLPPAAGGGCLRPTSCIWTPHHLILNELGLVLMWSLFAQDYDPVEWCVIVLVRCLGDQFGSVVAESARRLVCGRFRRAALRHGGGCAKHLAERAWDRWILLACLCAKLAYEQLGRARARRWSWSMHICTAPLAGFAVGAALSWRIAIIRHRSSA